MIANGCGRVSIVNPLIPSAKCKIIRMYGKNLVRGKLPLNYLVDHVNYLVDHVKDLLGGKIPNCQYCRQNIARGKWHTVNVSYKYSSQNTDRKRNNGGPNVTIT
jgi:hypothetical protein